MIKNAKICQIYLWKGMQKNNYCAPAKVTGVFSSLLRTTSFGSVVRNSSSTPKIPSSFETRADFIAHMPQLQMLSKDVLKGDNTAIVTIKPPKDYIENKMEALKNTVEKLWIKNSGTVSFLTANFVPHTDYKRNLEQVLDEHKRKFLKDSPCGNIRSVSLGANVVEHFTQQNIPTNAILFEYLQLYTLQLYFLSRMCFFFQTEGGTYELSWFTNPPTLKNTDMFLNLIKSIRVVKKPAEIAEVKSTLN